MNVEQENRGQALILRVAGRLDGNSAPELERIVLEKIAGGAHHLIFDLGMLDYVSSAGLRILLLAGKKLRASQGRLVLVGMRDMVREVLEMSGLLALFAVAETVEDGIAKR